MLSITKSIPPCKQQLFLILKLKLSLKNNTLLHHYLPHYSLNSLFLPQTVVPLSPFLIFTVISSGKTKCISLLSTIDYIERHQSPSTKKPHKRKKFVSLQVRILKKLNPGKWTPEPSGVSACAEWLPPPRIRNAHFWGVPGEHTWSPTHLYSQWPESLMALPFAVSQGQGTERKPRRPDDRGWIPFILQNWLSLPA